MISNILQYFAFICDTIILTSLVLVTVKIDHKNLHGLWCIFGSGYDKLGDRIFFFLFLVGVFICSITGLAVSEVR